MPRQEASYRFLRVKLSNWKNFRSLDLVLHRRVFLVGPNASGKSNLLDVFRFLRDVASEGGGLQFSVRQRGGLKAIRALSARQQPEVKIHVEVGSDPEGDAPRWQYELVISQDKQGRAKIEREFVAVQTPDQPLWRTLLDRPSQQDRRDSEQLTQTHLEQVTMNQEFRALAEFFASVRYLHVVPQLIREPERSLGRLNDPYGSDFLERLAKSPEKTRKAWLRRIEEALKVAVPQLSRIELWRDQRGAPHLRGKYQHWRPRGAWQAESQFSDGTLRLIGLLWSILDGHGPLLLEEPELSLHPEIVRHIPQMFARTQTRTKRQIIVSTHSTELLSDEGIAPEEVVLLVPSKEGTEVQHAAQLKDCKELLEGRVPLGEIVMAHTRPQQASQLYLFAKGL